MNIREASIVDAPKIADIHTASWRETYQNALTEQYLEYVVPLEREEVWIDRLGNPKKNQYVVVAESEGNVVGFACFYADENPDRGSYLDNLHVLKEYQSKGIGKSLFVKGANWCFQQELVGGLCLLVNQDNTKAQVFYKKLGAHNAEAGVWNAPDGSVVPTYWFVWNSFSGLESSG